jgi:hypothetical protein
MIKSKPQQTNTDKLYIFYMTNMPVADKIIMPDSLKPVLHPIRFSLYLSFWNQSYKKS